MSQPSKINYLVNQSSQADEFDVDVEQVFTNPPAKILPTSDTTTTIITDGAANPATVAVDGDGGFCGGSSIMTKCASLLVNKKTASTMLFAGIVGAGAIAGAGSYGYAQYKHTQQQQQALLAAVNSSGSVSNIQSKAGKSTSFCEPERVIQCGAVITDQKVVLSDDLFCTDDVSDSATTTTNKKTLNAAIKLSGPDAKIDCKGHTVRQITTESAAACNTSPGSDLNPSNARKNMKVACNLYYQVGIWLEGGATAINCKVEQFYDGFMIQDGGKVKKSEAASNRRGFYILGGEISDVYAHDNHNGIRAGMSSSSSLGLEDFSYTGADDDSIEVEAVRNVDVPNESDLSVHLDPSTLNITVGNVTSLIDPETEDIAVDALANDNLDFLIKIEDATSNNNLRHGIRLIDRDVKMVVKDSTFSHNGKSGIEVSGIGYPFWSPTPTFVQFEGTVSSHHNWEDGLEVKYSTEGYLAVINVKGVLNTYLNGGNGLRTYDVILLLIFEKSGLLNSCKNDGYDLGAVNDGGSGFVYIYVDGEEFVGGKDVSDYFTCGTMLQEEFPWGDGVAGAKGVTCTPCPVCN